MRRAGRDGVPLLFPGGRWNLQRRQHHPCHFSMELPHRFKESATLVPGRRRPDLHLPQISPRCACSPRPSRGHIGLEFLAAGRRRRTLVYPAQTLHGPGPERRAYLVGIARRPQSRRECEPADPGWLHLVEVIMSVPLVECVPNFSEGSDPRRVESIVAAMRLDGVHLLDWSLDPDQNRSIVTIEIGRAHV